MKHSPLAIILTLALLLWVACTSSPENTQYPDDEEIIYIETDSLLAESSMEQEHVSRHNKLSKGYRRTFNDKNDVHLAMAQRYGIEPLQSLEDASFAPKALQAMREAYTEAPSPSLKDLILRYRARFSL